MGAAASSALHYAVPLLKPDEMLDSNADAVVAHQAHYQAGNDVDERDLVQFDWVLPDDGLS